MQVTEFVTASHLLNALQPAMMPASRPTRDGQLIGPDMKLKSLSLALATTALAALTLPVLAQDKTGTNVGRHR
jgi:hypothetical protein